MVKWTAHALAQLRQIHDYISQDSPFYAKRVSDALASKTLALDDLPRLGRRVPELNEETIRELVLYSYRILYEIRPDNQIWILAVVHKRRHITPVA